MEFVRLFSFILGIASSVAVAWVMYLLTWGPHFPGWTSIALSGGLWPCVMIGSLMAIDTEIDAQNDTLESFILGGMVVIGCCWAFLVYRCVTVFFWTLYQINYG